MQLQGLLLILFMLIIIPMIALSANHNIFFIIMLVVLLIACIRNIHITLFNLNISYDEKDDEVIKEIEDMVNVDMKKFQAGIKVARDLFVILFFAYSSFYIYSFWLRLLASLIILYRIYNIISHNRITVNKVNKIKNLIFIMVNISIIILSIMVAYNKFIFPTY